LTAHDHDSTFYKGADDTPPCMSSEALFALLPKKACWSTTRLVDAERRHEALIHWLHSAGTRRSFIGCTFNVTHSMTGCTRSKSQDNLKTEGSYVPTPWALTS
jgi:hypothetical protein